MEVAAVARAWAPRGVSAASPRPCVRVALVPTLSATNLSDRTLRVRFRDDWETTEARCAGAAPRAFSVDVANRCSEPRTTLAPGAGPVAVRRSAAALASAIERRRAREERGARRNRGGGEDSEDSRADAARAEDADDLGDDSGRGAEELRDALEIFGGGGDDDEGGDEGEKGAVVSVAAALAAGPRGLEVELADGARVLVAVEPVGPEGCRSTCRAVTFRGCAASPTARAPQSPGPRIETTPRDETMPRGDRAPPAAPFALEVALPSASASLVDGADELALASFDRATVAWRRNLAGVGGERKKPSGKDSGNERDAEACDPFPHGVVSALEVSLGAFQLDDQTPRSAFPVVVWHNPALGPTLRATLTAAEGFETLEENAFSSGVVADRPRTVPSFHPAMCASLAPGGVHARVHEPFAWRLVDFARRLRLERVGSGGDARDDSDASRRRRRNDDAMRVGFFRLAPTTAKLSFKPAPDRRPSGACGPALASALAFLNLDRLPLSVGEFRRVSDAPVRPSDLANLLATHVKGEATGQALAALASVNHLGNVAGSLDQFGETIRGFGSQGSHSESDKNGSGGSGARGGSARDERESSAMAELTGGHVNVVTGALVGGHELVSGVLGGVAGVFTGAAGGFREAGVAGAVGGLGRGVVGAATSTAAGAVGFAARVVEGIEGTVGGGLDGVKGGQDANAATRRRLPLAVRGDGVVRAYDAADAAGLKLLGDAFVRDASGGKKKPFAGGRFEDALPLRAGTDRDRFAVLLSDERVGLVRAADARVEWHVPWSAVASVRLRGDEGGDAGGAFSSPASGGPREVVLALRGVAEEELADGDLLGRGANALGELFGASAGRPKASLAHARKTIECADGRRAAEIGARVEEVWIAYRARRAGGDGFGGGF